jgi:hypothetical protein
MLVTVVSSTPLTGDLTKPLHDLGKRIQALSPCAPTIILALTEISRLCPEKPSMGALSRARLVSGEGGRPLRFANKGDCLYCIPDTIR